MMKKNKRRNKPSIISLFSGAMGLDLGLEQAGFKAAVALESNLVAVETIKQNKPRLKTISTSVQDVTTADLLEKAGLAVGEASIVSGGPSCQSFSTAGKRHSVCDPRGTLFKDFCRIVREARPRFFVMENVKGLLSAAIKHRPLNQRGPGFPPLSREEELGSAFKVILQELQSLGYYTVFGLVNAADYGTPQARYRVIVIGSRDGENISLPQPTHAQRKSKNKKKWTTLSQAIRGTKSKDWVELHPNQAKYLELLSAGQNWRSLPKRLQREALGGAFVSWGGRCGFFRRLSWNKPSPSLTTQPNGRATMLCHPTKNRPLSVEEYARIQEFPIDFTFAGSVSEKYKLIGNAVPLSLGKAIGNMLRMTMQDTEKNGLPENADSRKGVIVCVDPVLRKRLSERSKTVLPPPSFRVNPDPAAAKKWLTRTGRSLNVTHVSHP